LVDHVLLLPLVEVLLLARQEERFLFLVLELTGCQESRMVHICSSYWTVDPTHLVPAFIVEALSTLFKIGSEFAALDFLSTLLSLPLPNLSLGLFLAHLVALINTSLLSMVQLEFIPVGVQRRLKRALIKLIQFSFELHFKSHVLFGFLLGHCVFIKTGEYCRFLLRLVICKNQRRTGTLL
jgi:hypothetical protein